EPRLVQRVQEGEGREVPGQAQSELFPEGSDRVVEVLVLGQDLLGRRRLGQLVVVTRRGGPGAVDRVPEDVLEDLPPLQVVVLDVLLLAAREALREGNEQLPAIEALRL